MTDSSAAPSDLGSAEPDAPGTAAAAHGVVSAPIRGRHAAAETRGDAHPRTRPVAFCLHALGASGREFEALASDTAFSSVFDVVALDLPGFGTAGTRVGTSIDEMVDVVIGAIRATAAPSWVLVGHSMGGKIASIVASRALSGDAPVFGLAGVVLLAGSPPVPEPMDEERRTEMLAWAADGPLDAHSAREFIDANVGSPLPPEFDALMLDDLQRADPRAWSAWLERGSREDRSADVGVLGVPALIVAGGDDGDLGEEAQRALNGAVYPRARFEVLGGAGHLLPLERTAEVAATIVDFWRTHAGLAPAVSAEFAGVIASHRTSARTRGILARRALADDPGAEPGVLTGAQLGTLRALALRVVPQGDGSSEQHPIDLAARVDRQLADGVGDGWRDATLPPDADAYRLALDALGSAGFADATGVEQDALLTRLAAGEFDPASPLSPAQLAAWFADARVDLARQWLAHPATMAEIGFDGFANGGDSPRKTGFDMLGADEFEGWEPQQLRVV